MPVKAVSRRSRARAARALTGILRSGSTAQALMADLDRPDARGVNNPTFSGRYKKSQAGVRERTSRLALDLFDLFSRPTGPHIAAFILPSLGRRFRHRRSRQNLRQNAISEKQHQASRDHFGACCCCRYAKSLANHRCVTCRHSIKARTLKPHQLRRLFANRAQGGDKQCAPRSDAVMSGVVNSGQES